ncbi:MAG TPA: choline/ethanolamine kinase family protein [Steroidobacteraceae bacterium]|nr:choline/ethanolamine kinase family protein [Steroidobacteraceae bacterium]
MPGRDICDAILALPCWSGPIAIDVLAGGMTNRNFRVSDRTGQRYVVRIGRDIPEHGIMRFNEFAAARAAYSSGIGPEVMHAADGILVSRFVEGAVLTSEQVRERRMLGRITALLRRCHDEIPRHFQGPALMFWVFQVIRGYCRLLRTRGAAPPDLDLALLTRAAERLERALGPVSIVFAHNDLLAANLIDDGQRLWLIDWDYAGFNSPLFDLANLAANNELTPELQAALLEAYFGGPVSADSRRGFAALMCASLLRETLWAAVCGLTSTIAFDYGRYGDDYRQRFERQWQEFETLYG